MGRKVQQVKAFIVGWFRMITFQAYPEAKRKQKICKVCPSRKGLVCGECGCPIKALSLAGPKELCELGKW
jgi:hypothetical protein